MSQQQQQQPSEEEEDFDCESPQEKGDDDDDDEYKYESTDDDDNNDDEASTAANGLVVSPVSVNEDGQQPQKQQPYQDDDNDDKDDNDDGDYATNFCRTLQDLVEAAPPISAVSDTPPHQRTHPQIDERLLRTRLFQSILVTHYEHLPPSPPPPPLQDNAVGVGGGNDHAQEDDDQDESFDPPWPPEHEAFCALPVIQEHVLLEIAAGRDSQGRIPGGGGGSGSGGSGGGRQGQQRSQSMELKKGQNMRVILPGSLRERGEFCVVELAFTNNDNTDGATTSTATSTSAAMSGATTGGLSPRRRLLPPTGDYRWRVRRTRFHCLNDYKTEKE